ncbi:HAD-IA family hydrolase [Paenisporosarcina sp. FSL H8-0542]|uniref:HAD family hydrolase n=1 Tax=Paenisporosarcina sp. FSL H8-0542 TaxID=2921401 RepID=UPI00315A0B72
MEDGIYTTVICLNVPRATVGLFLLKKFQCVKGGIFIDALPFNPKEKLKLPYLDGSESKIISRPKALDFARNMLEYEVISFDVFDTLLLRPFAQPHHLFMILGEKHSCVNFMAIRREAEKEARNQAKGKKGISEVTIYDIYEQVELRTGIDKQYGVQIELQTELEFCFANPYMKDVFEILKSQNKKIIAISDMYLTKSMIEQLLENSGFSGFFDVFVSCENHCSKRDKQLFNIALTKLGKDLSMVHVGTNYESDIKSAQELGIEARYYNNVHETGNQYRPDDMSELIASTYSGIVNTHLHNGIKQYTPHYEYGFIYGGLYILGYCKWIYDYAKQNNIDKILFLSRDGDIYRKVFNFLFTDMDTEYVYWSRIANAKYTIEKNRYDFLKRMVQHKAKSALGITIKGLFESLELEELFSLLTQHDLKEDDIIHKGNVKLIQSFLVKNWETVVKKLTEDHAIVKEYFMNIIQGNKKVAVVDVGWVGSGGAGIKYLIEQKWKLNCEVHSLVAACRHSNHTGNLSQIMKKEIGVYIFSRMLNRNLYDTHTSTKHNNVFFELFTQACYPSFSGFKRTEDGYKLLFDVPEVENYKIIEQIHQGIYDFVKLYKKTFSNYEYLFNISGYDAYLPFRMIIRDLRFIRENFGDLSFSRGVIADTENQSFETLNDIMDQANL